MSFWSHIGLSVIDKITDNAFDKLGNAIKDSDVTELVKQFTGILNGVEDKLGDIGDLFERRHRRREEGCAARGRRRSSVRLIREAREEMEKLHAEFADKMAEAMEAKIAGMVEAEVARRLTDGQEDEG